MRLAGLLYWIILAHADVDIVPTPVYMPGKQLQRAALLRVGTSSLKSLRASSSSLSSKHRDVQFTAVITHRSYSPLEILLILL